MKTITTLFAALLFISNIYGQCENPPSNMVSWWTGDANALDILGSNDGTELNDVNYATGMVDEAFLFDGIDDLVLVPDSAELDLTGDMTIMLWVRRIGYANPHQTVICKGAGFLANDEPAVFVMRFEFDITQFLFEDTDGNNIILGGPAFEDSMYHHYVYVRSGNQHSLYVDDFLFDSQTFSSSPASTLGLPLTIGAQYHDPMSTGNDYDFHFHGEVDEVMVFDRALTETEIGDIYNAGSLGVCKTVLSTEDVGISQSIDVYPNPAIDDVNFKLSETLISKYPDLSISLYNLQGRQVIGNIRLGVEASLDVSTLAKGIYIYTIQNEHSILMSGQLIKQ